MKVFEDNALIIVNFEETARNKNVRMELEIGDAIELMEKLRRILGPVRNQKIKRVNFRPEPLMGPTDDGPN